MKPPSDVKPSDLFLKLCEPQPSCVVDFPRYIDGQSVGKLRLRVLTQDEIDSARARAEQSFVDRGITGDALRNPITAEILADTTAREVLAVSAMTADGPTGADGEPLKDEHGAPIYGRVFRDARDLKKLRPQEIAVLFAAHMLTQDKFGPYEKTIQDAADLDAWVRRLAEGGAEFPLLRLRLHQLHELTLSLAQHVASLYEILASQRESLPPGLASRLDAYFSDTISSGLPASESTPGGGSDSVELSADIAAQLAADIAAQ